MRANVFETFYATCERYKKENGNLNVPFNFSYGDYHLGMKVNYVRSVKRLTQEQFERLDSLGFVWAEKRKKQMLTPEEICLLVKQFVKENNTRRIPTKYVTKDGIRLGMYMLRVRCGLIPLNQEQKEAFAEIGVSLEPYYYQHRPSKLIAMIKEYYQQHGNCFIRADYVTKDGVSLGQMVSYIKKGLIPISISQRKTLDEMGFPWHRIRNTNIAYYEIKKSLMLFKKKFHTVDVPFEYYDRIYNIPLGEMVQSIRYGRKRITKEQKEELLQMGFRFKEKQIDR